MIDFVFGVVLGVDVNVFVVFFKDIVWFVEIGFRC